jgi:pyruvate dehydrogenase (quinone)
VPKPPREHARLRSSTDYTTPDSVPKKGDLERAVEVLNSGQRVAMLVGEGALHATEEVTEVAEILGAGVAKALLGKVVLSDYEPWVTGSIGMLGTGPSWDLMEGADTLLMVGTNMPYSDFLPKEGQARGVQIDINGKWLGFATLPRSTSSATRTRPYRHSYRSSRRRPTAPGARESRGASSGGGRSSRRGR